VAPLPQVDFPTIQVTANLPGASPETMASSVATPLEYQFAQIPGVSQMTSTSVLGSSADHAAVRLDRSIDAARRTSSRRSTPPRPAAEEPARAADYKKVNPADSPILILSVHSDVLPLTAVDDYCRERDRAADLADSRRRAGVHRRTAEAGGAGAGGSGQDRLARHPARGHRRRDQRNATVDAPKGSINGRCTAFAIYDNDQLLKAAPWNDIVVAYKNGAPVRIRDIGVAVDGRRTTRWSPGRTASPASCC
jgi:HAE1 family hydrophobic/amphiphilic exporter-1